MLGINHVMRACEGKVEDGVSSQASQHIVQTESFTCTSIFFSEATRNSINKALNHGRITVHSLQGKERGHCCEQCCPRYVESILKNFNLPYGADAA